MERQLFTDYVRSLDATGDPPDADSFARLWSALGRAVRHELKRRGLWDVPPSAVGVYGSETWQDGSGDGSGGALEELLAGCYSHIFIRRLGGLKAQLEVKPNIDGLVFLGIRNYLHDAQKKHDPFGFRVFEMLRSAIRGALETDELVVLGGDPRIRNDTILGLPLPVSSENSVSRPEGAAPSAGREPSGSLGGDSLLNDLVGAWNDTLLPELITARGASRKRVIAVLQSLLLRLPSEGVERFSVKQIIDPLKSDARARWGAMMDEIEGEQSFDTDADGNSVRVRVISADTRIEDRDRFDKLATCVSESVNGVEEVRVRGYLSTLWEFLYTQASGTAIGEAVLDGPMPSARKLAQLLRIPRDRLPSLFSILRGKVESCRAAISSRIVVRPVYEGTPADKTSSGEVPADGNHPGAKP